MRSDRLELTPLTRNDFTFFKEINTHPFVRRFLWDDRIMPDDVFGQILSQVEQYFKVDQWGLWKIQTTEDNAVVGYAGLWKFFEEEQPQLLYALLPEHTGKGYAAAASTLVMDYSFRVLKYAYLNASMDRDNIASRRVCERLGFHFEAERVVEGKAIVFYKVLPVK